MHVFVVCPYEEADAYLPRLVQIPSVNHFGKKRIRPPKKGDPTDIADDVLLFSGSFLVIVKQLQGTIIPIKIGLFKWVSPVFFFTLLMGVLAPHL